MIWVILLTLSKRVFEFASKPPVASPPPQDALRGEGVSCYGPHLLYGWRLFICNTGSANRY